MESANENVDGASITGDSSTSRRAASFRWSRCMELGYLGGETEEEEAEPVCFRCGKESQAATDEGTAKKLSKCSRCHVASYCSRDCQLKDWKGGEGSPGHKFSCAAYKRVGTDMMITFFDDKEQAREDIFSRVRFYACPYAVHKANSLGRGFLFVQSDSSLAVMSLPKPVLSNGRHIIKTRSLLLHFLTMNEYDKELCRDDFELTAVRDDLKIAVEEYDKKKELVVLMRFRCGHVAVGIAPLVPDFGICTSLGEDYYSAGTDGEPGALQLNLDDI